MKMKDDSNLNKKDNIHLGHRQRMKEKYYSGGIDMFSDHEKIEMLLYFTNKVKDTNGIAHSLIKEFGNLENVFNADIEYLQDVKGVGKETALLINYVSEMHNYLIRNSYKYDRKTVYLQTLDEAGRFCCNYFINRKKESLIAILLNAERKILKICTISEGTVDRTAIYSREIVELVLKHNATSIILAHNHPGNNLNPSGEDVEATAKADRLLGDIDVVLVEHFICSGMRYECIRSRFLM